MQAVSAQPKLAWRLIPQIAKVKTIEDLEDEEGLGILRVKVRNALMKIIKGQLITEIENLDVNLSKADMQLNGRQLAFLMRKMFDINFKEGAVVTERKLHGLVLQKDNIPQYLNKLDGAFLR